jgi:hypothetical protein
MFIQNTLEDELTFAGFYPAIARVLHEGPKGAVRFEVPDMYGTDDGSGENLSDWIEASPGSVGGLENKGDHGAYFPPAEGALYAMGFIGRDHTQPFVIPLGMYSEEPEPNKELASKEFKEAIKKKENHRFHQYKTPAGAGWSINDTTGKEGIAFQSNTGAGLFIDGPNKGEEPKQEKDKKTKARTAYKRGDDCVACKTQKAPGEVFKNKVGYVRLLGQNGSGLTIVDADDGSGMIIRVADSKNSENGPSIFLSSKDGGSIILTAGAAQVQVRGKTGDVKFNKNIIQELVKFEVETDTIKPLMTQLAELSKTSLYVEVTTA